LRHHDGEQAAQHESAGEAGKNARRGRERIEDGAERTEDLDESRGDRGYRGKQVVGKEVRRDLPRHGEADKGDDPLAFYTAPRWPARGRRGAFTQRGLRRP